MASERLRFDHGTDGANLTVASSAGGEDSVGLSYVQNVTATFSADAATDGPLGVRMVVPATTGYLRRDQTFPGPRWSIRIPFEIPVEAIASGLVTVFSVRAPGIIVMLRFGNDKRPVLAIGGSSDFAASKKATALGTGKYFAHVSFTLESATGALDGTVDFKISPAHDDSEVAYEWSTTAAPTGIDPPAQWRFGETLAATGLTHMDFDSIEIGDLAEGFFGRMPPLSAPPELGDLSELTYRLVPKFVHVGPDSVTVTPPEDVVVGTNFIALPLRETSQTYEVTVNDLGADKSTTRTYEAPAALSSDWEILVREGTEWLAGTV